MSTDKQDRGEVVVFEARDGSLRLDVRLKNETVWLSQRHIAELLGTSTDNVGLHLKNIYAEGELDEAATAEESSVVQVEGRRRVTRRVRQQICSAALHRMRKDRTRSGRRSTSRAHSLSVKPPFH